MINRRKLGGAPLVPININRPGAAGLNTEQAGAILDPQWATVLDNAVFDANGRPASRKGFLSVTTTPTTGVIKRIFEFYQSDGTSEVIYSTDNGIFRDINTPVDISGTVTVSDGNIRFLNFNDKLIAVGAGTGGLPAVRTGGNFSTITVNSGTAPDGTIGTAAYGRLWIVDDDGKTIRYSALLDETRWDVADGGGLIDMSNVWPSGQDSVVAIKEFGGQLIVFGRNSTVVWTDGTESSLGIDPLALYVSDTIPGQGAVSQFAIEEVQGELWVLTSTGIVALTRELVQRSTPLTSISRYIHSEIINNTAGETDEDAITFTYSPNEALLVATFPSTRQQFVFDTRSPLPDGSFRATTWSSRLQTLAYIRSNREMYGSFATTADGEILQYTGTADNGDAFAFDYESGWLELGQELNTFLKFVKRITSFVFIEKNVTVSYKIAYDFGLSEFSLQNSGSGGRVSEWGNFEWGDNGVYDITDPSLVPGTDIAEWSGTVALRTIDVPGKGSGQYIKVGLRLNTNSGAFALQQLNMYAKIGRNAT